MTPGIKLTYWHRKCTHGLKTECKFLSHNLRKFLRIRIECFSLMESKRIIETVWRATFKVIWIICKNCHRKQFYNFQECVSFHKEYEIDLSALRITLAKIHIKWKGVTFLQEWSAQINVLGINTVVKVNSWKISILVCILDGVSRFKGKSVWSIICFTLKWIRIVKKLK